MPDITMARQITPGRVLLLAFAVVFLGSSLAPAASRTNGTNALPGADIFDRPNVVRISVTIPEAGMRLLRNDGGPNFGGDPDRKRAEARATITDGSRTYKDVAVTIKGAAGSWQAIDQRPGLTLKFDKYVKGQTFHGLEKLSLNNCVQDPTYINEKISRELFEKAGIPVPRADYAVVTLNGRLLGLYGLVEGFNKQFLSRYFKNVSGNLYDGGFCQEVTTRLNVNSGDKPEDQRDREKLAQAAVDARTNNQLAPLDEVLDLNRFVTMIALEVLLCHWDGYGMNRNNYRVFSDKESGKMIFMPHGMDQVFGIDGRGADTTIFPQMKGMVARALVGTSEGRSKYRMKLMDLRTNLFNAEAIVARVREIEARIKPVLAEIRPAYASRQQSYVNALCRNIMARAENLDEQFADAGGEIKFDKNGIAHIDDWRPGNTTAGGQSERRNGPDGSALLFLRSDGRSVSWRTRAMLPKGSYRFEGRVRTKIAAGAPGMGANVRISGARQIRLVQGEADWVQCSFDFEVQEAVADIELICELRGGPGSAWFDSRSLQLVRVH